MKRLAILGILALGVLSNAAWANDTLFFCKTVNHKELKLSTDGTSIFYSFGKKAKPELQFNVPISQVDAFGGKYGQNIDLPRGNYRYYVAITDTSEYPSFVSVFKDGKEISEVKCLKSRQQEYFDSDLFYQLFIK